MVMSDGILKALKTLQQKWIFPDPNVSLSTEVHTFKSNFTGQLGDAAITSQSAVSPTLHVSFTIR